MVKKITCKTGLKKNIVGKEVFDREIELCKMLSKENREKCGWGICKNCGVVPLVIKLHKGVLLEKDKDISKARDKYLKD